MKRPLAARRSSSSTTHISDSEPERETKRRGTKSSPPPMAARAPLVSIQNNSPSWPRTQKWSQDRVYELENRVQRLERELKDVRKQLGSQVRRTSSSVFLQ